MRGGRERDRLKQRTNVKEREREIEREGAKVGVRKWECERACVRQECLDMYTHKY